MNKEEKIYQCHRCGKKEKSKDTPYLWTTIKTTTEGSYEKWHILICFDCYEEWLWPIIQGPPYTGITNKTIKQNTKYRLEEHITKEYIITRLDPINKIREYKTKCNDIKEAKKLLKWYNKYSE